MVYPKIKNLAINQNLTKTSSPTKQSSKDYYYANHIEFLRNNFAYLVDYKNQTGQLNPIFKLVEEDLFDKDPFIVYGASLIATLAFADKNLYH